MKGEITRFQYFVKECKREKIEDLFLLRFSSLNERQKGELEGFMKRAKLVYGWKSINCASARKFKSRLKKELKCPGSSAQESKNNRYNYDKKLESMDIRLNKEIKDIICVLNKAGNSLESNDYSLAVSYINLAILYLKKL